MDMLDFIAAGVSCVALVGFGYLLCQWVFAEFGDDA